MLHRARQLQRHGLFLAVLLFCTQLGTVLHAYDLDQHSDNSQQCQLCVHASNLGHALGGQAPALPVIDVTNIRIVAVDLFGLQSIFTTHYHSRAPPVHA